VNNIVVKPAGVIVALTIFGVILFLIGQRVFSDKKDDRNQVTKTNTTQGTSPDSSSKPSSSDQGGLPLILEEPAATLRNPDFETQYVVPRPYNSNGTIHGGIAEHWYDDSSWAPVNVDYAQDQKNPHGGTSCQRIDIHTAQTGNFQLVQTLRLETGKTYTGGFYLRADHPMTIHVLLRQAAQPAATYGSASATVDTTWKQITATGTIGPDSITYLMVQADEPGTLWVDDASLQSK